MTRIEVPQFEPCPQCAGGKVLRNGKSEQCDCWVKWWHAVRESICGAPMTSRKAER